MLSFFLFLSPQNYLPNSNSEVVLYNNVLYFAQKMNKCSYKCIEVMQVLWYKKLSDEKHSDKLCKKCSCCVKR
jgi:hypothetical protein